MSSDGIINLLVGAIITAIVGFLASWISSYLSNDRLVKTLEWCDLALSKNSQTKHSNYLLNIKHEAETGLLASHYAPKGRYLACALMSLALGVFIGLPTDEPLLAQIANRMVFLFISTRIVFYGHRAFVKRRALERFFLGPNSESDDLLEFNDKGYLDHLSIKGSFAVLCLVSPTILIGFLTYLIDTRTTPSWFLMVVLVLILASFAYMFTTLPTETSKTIHNWSQVLLEQSAVSEDDKQTADTDIPNPRD
jgi:hypothetical protein